VRATATDTEAAISGRRHGNDRDYLLSHRGEGLGGLQYLLNRIIYRGRRGKKIQVDCDGFASCAKTRSWRSPCARPRKARARGEECLLSR